MSVLRTHEFDLPPPPPPEAEPWEEEEPTLEDDAEDPMTQDEATDCCVEIRMSLYFESSISAEVVGTLCHYASIGGLGGEVAKLAAKPGMQSGKYSRHMKRYLGFDKDQQQQYLLDVPGRDLHGLAREQLKIPVQPVHEVLMQEMEESPLLLEELQLLRDTQQLPPAYYAHPLVQEHPDQLHVPFELYFDGVPYSLVDSVVGVWTRNCVSGTRHLVALLRKRTTCKCGCKGWCSFFELHRFLHWCCEALYDGVWPVARHDGLDWLAGDQDRKSRAGQPMPMKMLLLYIKADWAEMCERFGFPTWQSSMRPCLCCSCPPNPEEFYKIRGLGLGTPLHHLNTDADYAQACDACERHVLVDEALAAKLKPVLRYDNRKDGPGGRVLQVDLPDQRLLAGDRVEPSVSLPDIAKLEATCSRGAPLGITFWRKDNETLCTHRCPLWDDRLGISPATTLAFDTLHVLYRGTMLEWST